MIGHVDHGKTTLTQALSGKWTDTFSEEIKKGITIKLGYANTSFYKDNDRYNAEGKGKFQRCVSFVDAPGHEALMAVMLTASSIMDGALLLVSAKEGIRAQTKEHAMAAKIAGIKNIIVVQNKLDAVDKEQAEKNYKEIQEFLKKYEIEAPVIPISALHRVNIDLLIEAIENIIPTPKRDPKSKTKFLVVRSFDVNKPGTPLDKLVGGVLGGCLVKGVLKVGDEVEIRPGIKTPDGWKPIFTEITSLATEKIKLKNATPGGSLAIGTKLDPNLTKQDGMLGAVVGHKGELPPVLDEVIIQVELFDHVVGIEGDEVKVTPLREGEPLIVNINTTVSVGVVKKAGQPVTITLKKPVCADKEDRFVLSRRVDSKWRLVGYGAIK
ncbi:MAG: translation initiation factor IF-2 subunit gamma [Candidatus Altiarchaeota archaeon]|nr:translation initiation factor IF-2 subunit gamma [Candidatus Altiarchaeota archaeon]